MKQNIGIVKFDIGNIKPQIGYINLHKGKSHKIVSISHNRSDMSNYIPAISNYIRIYRRHIGHVKLHIGYIKLHPGISHYISGISNYISVVSFSKYISVYEWVSPYLGCLHGGRTCTEAPTRLPSTDLQVFNGYHLKRALRWATGWHNYSSRSSCTDWRTHRWCCCC